MKILQASKQTLAAGLFISAVAIGAIFTSSLNTPKAHAANNANFKAGNIMSDATMSNKNAMSVQQIQAFLDSKNKCNNTNTYLAAQYPQVSYSIKNGKFVCMAQESFNGQSAAQLIWQASQDYSINPQVLIVLLEKEQGLISDTWPNSRQYKTATGYGCPDTAACDSQYFGLNNQIRRSASLFRGVLNGGWSNYPVGQTYVQYNPNAACGGSVVNIQNRATSALYRYTPYQPNQSALNAGYGTGDGCGAYGNRNFWAMFTDWFGSTQGTVYRGVDMDPVFNADFYLNRYPDVRNALGNNASAAFQHFTQNGIAEQRQGSENFDIRSYRNRHPDLRMAFGTDLFSYISHYVSSGRFEGRVATGDFTLVPITTINGVNYSSVYDFDTYKAKNYDISRVFGNDDAGAITHFVNYGMAESRVAKNDFIVSSYRNRYPDLRSVFGGDLKSYFLHYVKNGKSEGRTAIGDYYGGTSSLAPTNYSAVYDFGSYRSRYTDIRMAFNLDDTSTLQHFVNSGMSEGRIGNDSFNVKIYKDRYPDLRAIFGNNLKSYYLHYISYGAKEGRSGI